MPVTIRNTSRKAPPNDYLKYWKVIKYWVKRKYKINTGDLEQCYSYIANIYLIKLSLKNITN